MKESEIAMMVVMIIFVRFLRRLHCIKLNEVSYCQGIGMANRLYQSARVSHQELHVEYILLRRVEPNA